MIRAFAAEAESFEILGDKQAHTPRQLRRQRMGAVLVDVNSVVLTRKWVHVKLSTFDTELHANKAMA